MSGSRRFMRAGLRGAAAAALCLALWSCGEDDAGAGQAEPPAAAESLTGAEHGAIGFETLDGYDFVDFSKAGTVTISGDLFLPAGEPKAVVILSHGSSGRGANQARWAAFLGQHGYASFAIDHFAGRGASSTVASQLAVSEQQMMADILKAAALLKTDPRFAERPVAHMGWSKGATAGAMAGVDRFAAFADPDGNANIALFLEFYPFCGVSTEGERASRPIRILHGDADDWTPIKTCRAFVEGLRRTGAVAALQVVRGGRHGFDNWLDDRVLTVADAVTVRDSSDACLLAVSEQGLTHTVDGALSVDTVENRKAYLERCGVKGVTVGGRPEAQMKIEALVLDLLEG